MAPRVYKLLSLAMLMTFSALLAFGPTAGLATTETVIAPQAGAEAATYEPVGFLPSPEEFVTQQYEDFLGRSPDAGGLAYWSNVVEDGFEPSAMIEALALSPEFEGVMAPIVRLYYAHFLRPPDYAGMTYWAGVARGGWSVEKISEEFVLSTEFRNSYGSLSNDQYVRQVYLNVLGRSADAGGLAYWRGQLGAGLTRGELMVAFSDSAEYRQLIGSKVLATMLYVGMLRRAPEAAGLDYWAGVIDANTPYRNVIAGFLGAGEYGNRMNGIFTKVNPLTGVPSRKDNSHAALAVKIDNVSGARPQTNIDRTDIIYEEMVEGRLTRLVAVFHSDLPDVVGPVRSIRTTDFDILAQLNTPLLSASGANAGVLAGVANADLVNVNALAAGGAYFRSTDRRAPHNMYTRPADLYAAANGAGGRPPQLFTYRAPGVGPVGGTSSSGVGVEYGRTTAEFTWSGSERSWLRTQDGSAHVTADGTRLAPQNVVVLEVDYGTSPVDANSPHAHTVGSGRAFVYTAGQLVTGTWSRTAADHPIKIKDGQGREIGLTRGQTFVELAPPGSIRLR